MGNDLYHDFASAKKVFEGADERLGFSLSRLCFEGSEDELRQTINTQPAVVTVSYACLMAVKEVSGRKEAAPLFVAGHSLGEYTALAVAGVLDFADTVYLSRQRGRLMQEAGQERAGGMAAIIGLDEGMLSEVCAEAGVSIANINCPGQLVISGGEKNIAKAMDLARDRGAYRVIPLQVSGAFHTPLMQSAVDGMTEVIATLDFKNPAIPIIANTTAQPLTTAEAVKKELLHQLCHCVQWQRSVEYMVANGVTTFVEIGPGRVLTGLIKRINSDVKTLNIGDAEAVRKMGDGPF
ncbi:MAG: ACP S-malonyltransferase [Dehalococcoidia bacterium]|nr:MAG: ACP S-malonyltransferase [Dehalococcoidia bacterium]